MALNRIAGNGVPRMPPLATNELDQTSIQLLTDWITQDLPQRQNFSQWQTANFGSPDDPNAAPTADPDGDGQDNLHEFLANTDPRNAASFLPAAAVTSIGSQLSLSFTQPANRSAVVETSTDLADWTLWDVPGNSPTYVAIPQLRALNIPLGDDHRFFRLRLAAP
jgi:hypothetical protein